MVLERSGVTPGTSRPGRPGSTYRLQLHRGFDFREARAVLPYLADLGVTHCYLSPIFRAVPGSTHGYDVCRHTEINPELGGDVEFEKLSDEAVRLGLGIVLDFVPNHMSNDPQTNEWWRDVLENGPSSTYARFFDIDWEPTKPELKDRLLLPILGDPYGDALEAGQLVLRFESGGLVLDVGDHHLPINPRRSPIVYEHDLETLERDLGAEDAALREFLSVLTALRNLPAYTERDAQRIVERHREKEVARARLTRVVESSPAVRAHIERAVATFNGRAGDPRSFDRLHDLLELQAYRLASWRTAADEINYRRFFDINGLAGLRVEDPAVFDAIHSLLLRLIDTGRANGLRLDHIDGLHDPGGYLKHLAQATRRTAPYIVVEKILAHAETLPGDWPVDGTTGYGFLNLVNSVLTDGRASKRLQRLYARVTGRRDPFPDVAYDSKRLIIATALSSEFQVLAQAVNRFSEQDRRFRDFTLASIRRALREVVACFPVYRTYVGPRGATAPDADALDTAIRDARRRNPAMESSIFDFLRFVLLPDATPPGAAEGRDDKVDVRAAIAMRFQQYTAPVHAKGVEDTAFYQYHVLASTNEVGGDPTQIGRSVAEFHRANLERQQRVPGDMLATTTHDTKRSEDARARITVLSEMPDEWQAAVSRWRRMNAPHRTTSQAGQAPDANDEYLFYQALLGAWPPDVLESPVPPEAAPDAFVARMQRFMEKAVKEAKLHTSWITPNVEYEQAVARFVDRTLSGRRAAPFLASFVSFVQRVARAGVTNALAQLVLKLTCPGVPDFYQGTEVWDHSLVDPDNRRPVDWALRRRLLETLTPPARPTSNGRDSGGEATRHVATDLLDKWHDGRIKLFVTAVGLQWRRMHASTLMDGEYVPLEVDGVRSIHLIAFARQAGRHAMVVVVPRLTTSLCAQDTWPVGEQTWGDTTIRLSHGLAGRGFRHVFTGERLTATPKDDRATVVLARDVLRIWPVAVLSSEPVSESG